MNANIFSINRMRFGTDGEGIRTLVGFCGCPLRCKYCINSSSWNGNGKGKIFSASMLLKKVSIDNLYFLSSGGGITFGGGEPLLHSEFIKEFIEIAPKKWTYNVETSLAVPYKNIELISNFIDLFIIDIKTLDEKIYKEYTGGDLNLAKNNLEKLLKAVGNEKILVRVPLIENYADEKSQEETVQKLLDMGFVHIEKFKYVIT